MDSTKKFGLVMPKRLQSSKVTKKSIFESDSDDDAPVTKRPKIPQKKITIKQENVEDPSIYEYDNIYDEMKAKQSASIAPKEIKNSRYIDTLLKAADKRKKEYERRVERKIQVEREKEGDEFKDKEEFVTSTYRKKMQEREEEEERERREAMLNDMMDVTKQKDLSGFYRHFLKQTVGEEKIPTFGERSIKKEKLSDEEESIKDKVSSNIKRKTSIKKEPEEKLTEQKTGSTASGKESICENISLSKEIADLDRDSDGVEIDSDSDNSVQKNYADYNDSDDSDINEQHKKSVKGDEKKRLKYAKNSRQKILEINSSQSDIENESIASTHTKRSELHAEEKPSSDEEQIKYVKDIKRKSQEKRIEEKSSEKNKNKRSSLSTKPNSNIMKKQAKIYRKRGSDFESESDLDTNAVEVQPKQDLQRNRHDTSDESDKEDTEKKVDDDTNVDDEKNKTKVKCNIFEKRTVGDVFAQAQARYFQRMANRSA